MKKLRFIKQFRGCSQAYMAIKLGMMLNAFSGYEADTAKFKDTIWDRIAVILDFSKLEVKSIKPVIINLPL